MDSKSLITGLILIALGLLFFAHNFGWVELSWETLWPWMLILGGILFLLGWLKNRAEFGLLLPAAILLVYGAVFLYCVTMGWWYMGEYRLWAFFIIGPGVGFFAMYFFGRQDKAFLVPAAILSGMGAVFLAGVGSFHLIWPLALIAIGVRLLFKGRPGRNAGTSQHPSNSTVSREKELH